MSEITLSQAAENYAAAKAYLESLKNQKPLDTDALESADIRLTQARLTFTGLGGKIEVTEDEETARAKDRSAILIKLNGYSGA